MKAAWAAWTCTAPSSIQQHHFYSLGVEMGVDAIHDFMKPLSFGQITGIDLGGEVRGVLPSMEWKRNTYKRPEMKRWYSGETVSLGIGQGCNNFTMLQLAMAEATLANGGTRHRPHLIKAVRTRSLPGDRGAAAARREPGLQPEERGHHQQRPDGREPGRHGAARVPGCPYTSAGKTGTAQAVAWGQNTKYNARLLEEHKRDHSLLPPSRPWKTQGGGGRDRGKRRLCAAAAAPIVRRVFDYWLLGQYPSEQDLAAVSRARPLRPSACRGAQTMYR